MNIGCPHRPPCPGCPRFGEAGIGSIAMRALRNLAQLHHLPEPAAITGDAVGFRMRARLAIRGRVGSPKLGLFESDSHRVVHIPNCSVHHPLINRVAGVVRRAIVDTRTSSYSEKARMGLARYLQVVVERDSQTAQVVLVANCATPAPMSACLDLIRERLGTELHSLWFNANCENTNAILGPDFHLWCGPESVVERFGGAAVHYPPGAFGQSNLDMSDKIVECVRRLIPPGARVVEFYAGVGAIGLSVLTRVSEIQMNELSPQSLHGLDLGLADLDGAERSKVSVVPGSAAATYEAASQAQLVIADPPRKGLDPALTEWLSVHPPERFLYISCGVDSLMNDVAHLTSRGTLRLDALTAFNLMPFTEHVETLAQFERAGVTTGAPYESSTGLR